MWIYPDRTSSCLLSQSQVRIRLGGVRLGMVRQGFFFQNFQLGELRSFKVNYFLKTHDVNFLEFLGKSSIFSQLTS